MPAKGDTKYSKGSVFESNLHGPIEVIEFVHSKMILVRFFNTGYEYWTSSTRIVRGEVKDRSIIIPMYGVAYNDADYTVETGTAGNKQTCPYYRVWRNMIVRCYSDQYPAYVGCSVCPKWLYFSQFKSWMKTQDWVGKELDKDLLIEGNREYGPNACLFVTRDVNVFAIGKSDLRGTLPQGVTLNKHGRYIAQGVKEKGDHGYLGSFSTAEEAHEAWRQAKKLRAIALAAEQTCERTAEAILKRFA